MDETPMPTTDPAMPPAGDSTAPADMPEAPAAPAPVEGMPEAPVAPAEGEATPEAAAPAPSADDGSADVPSI